MLCSSCGHDNRQGRKFCAQCGAALALACASCGAANEPGERFCGQCGGPLAVPATSEGEAGLAPTTVTPTPQPAVPLPTSFADGRYQVKGFLGEGGRKRVYLAHDTKLDRDVAVAIVKTDGLDADGIVRVHREAQAMGRLGDHPHIVTVFDTGDDNGSPYIISQYMAGGAVEELLRQAEQQRLPVDRAMRIAEQVCQALEHAHKRGIIHRDLKPGNVWLTEDGTAQLGDFGLAVALDRSRMTMQGMMMGTVAYMAPEQALGRAPDARSDLYALGATLYEMVAGRPPFLGDNAVGVISQHINTAPVAPGWHNPEVPKPLEALILRLLAKSPEERPASASDVGAELRRILERSTQEPVAALQAEMVTDLRGLDWGRFVGRREEMEQLKDALEGILSGKGSLAFVAGEPGIGKTRLAEEFAVYAGLRGAQVLTGRCYEGEASIPYRAFVEALRQYVLARPDAELRQQLGAGAPEVATLVSEVRERFPEIPEPPKLDAEAERLRLFDSVTQFLRNAAQGSPLVLFLDDMHWSDKPSLLLLQHVARNTGGDRVLVLGTYRDVELDRTHPLSEALGTLRRLPNFQRVLLRGLPLDSVEELLTAIGPSTDLAGRHLLAQALYQETEGNPFFIREVLSHLVEEGKIVREGGRWVGKVTNVSELGIPEGVREVIGRRLSRLSDGCNRMLTRASSMARGFTWEALKAISPETEAELLDLLDEALGAQLIAERKSEATLTYDFTHALIRQTLYGELSGPRRVLLHRQIGEALEKLYGANLEPYVAELAHHFYEAAPGGDVEKAIDYARRAGDRGMALYAYEDAAGHYERALQALELKSPLDESLRCDLLLALGGAQGYAGNMAACKETARAAMKLARKIDDAERFGEAMWLFAGGLETGSVDGELVGLLEEALNRLPEADSGLRSRLTSRLSSALAWSPDQERRTILGQEAVEMARRAGDAEALGFAMSTTFMMGWSHQDARQGLATADEILSISEGAGNTGGVVFGHFLRAGLYLEMGDIPAVDQELAVHRKLADELRQPYGLWFVSLMAAMRALLDGRWEEAERLVQEALEVGQAPHGQNAFGMYGAQMFALRREQGRLGELEGAVKAYVAQYPAIWAWHSALGFMYCEVGRLDEARAVFEQYAYRLESLPRDWVWLIGMVLLAEVCWHLGDAPRAARLYDLLLPYAEKNVVVGANAHCYGATSRSLGLLAATMERWEDAERQFQHALELNGRMSPPWLAWTQYQYAEMLLRRDGPGDRQSALALMSDALETAQKLAMKPLVERALALKLRTQGIEGSDLRTSIDNVASLVYADKPDMSRHAAPDGTVTIMFSDIEGSTALAERLGDKRFMVLLREHNTLVRERVKAHGGFEVKSEGDGFMVAFQSARRALDCAIDIQRALAERNAGPRRGGSRTAPTTEGHGDATGASIRVRIGLHSGETIKEGEDFFGKNVILAARIASQAQGGEILVSSLLKALVDSAGDIAFGDGREVELKGLSGTHEIYSVEWVA